MVEVTHRLKASATAVSLCESSIHAYRHTSTPLSYSLRMNEKERERDRVRGWEDEESI